MAEKTRKIKLGSIGLTWNKHFPYGEGGGITFPPGTALEVTEEKYKGYDKVRQRGTLDFTDLPDDAEVDYSQPAMVAAIEEQLRKEGKPTTAPIIRGKFKEIVEGPAPAPVSTPAPAPVKSDATESKGGK